MFYLAVAISVISALACLLLASPGKEVLGRVATLDLRHARPHRRVLASSSDRLELTTLLAWSPLLSNDWEYH